MELGVGIARLGQGQELPVGRLVLAAVDQLDRFRVAGARRAGPEEADRQEEPNGSHAFVPEFVARSRLCGISAGFSTAKRASDLRHYADQIGGFCGKARAFALVVPGRAQEIVAGAVARRAAAATENR